MDEKTSPVKQELIEVLVKQVSENVSYMREDIRAIRGAMDSDRLSRYQDGLLVQHRLDSHDAFIDALKVQIEEVDGRGEEVKKQKLGKAQMVLAAITASVAGSLGSFVTWVAEKHVK